VWVNVRGGLAVAVLAMAVASCTMHNNDLPSPPHTGPTKAPVRVPAAARYVHKIAAEASDLQQAVQTAEAGIQSLALNPDSTDPSATAQLAQLIQQQRADITAAQAPFRIPTARGQIGAWETETVLAARDLDTALSALDAYLADGNTAPLDDYTRQLATGSTEWNDAVTHLWAAAAINDPPTL
jgi:hypothetical protein